MCLYDSLLQRDSYPWSRQSGQRKYNTSMLWSRFVLSPSEVIRTIHVSHLVVNACSMEPMSESKNLDPSRAPCSLHSKPAWWMWEDVQVWNTCGTYRYITVILHIFYRSPDCCWRMEQILKLLIRVERRPLMWDNELHLLFNGPPDPTFANHRFLPNPVISRSYIILGKRYIAEVFNYFHTHPLTCQVVSFIYIFQDGALAFEEPPGSWLKKKDDEKGGGIVPSILLQ